MTTKNILFAMKVIKHIEYSDQRVYRSKYIIITNTIYSIYTYKICHF